MRNVEDAERRWFYGGAEQLRLARASDTAESFLLASTVMVQDKVTPLHTHPADESMYVIEGELLVHLDGEEHVLRAGGFSLAPAGIPHAFKVVSESATVLFLHTPGTCEAFYLGASMPLAPGEDERALRHEQDHGVRTAERRLRVRRSAAVLMAVVRRRCSWAPRPSSARRAGGSP